MVDTMNHVKPSVSTVCVGMAASGAAILLSAGAKGKRFALPNAEVMIHQPHGDFGDTNGPFEDVDAEHLVHINLRKPIDLVQGQLALATKKIIEDL